MLKRFERNLILCSILGITKAKLMRNLENLLLGGLHGKHAVQRGIWVPTQYLLWD
jgi:hypothetical protein